MPFTVEDFEDLVAILRQRPEWRDELRRLVLSDQLLGLPEVVRELAEAQRRTEQRVEELAEAQRRTEERLERLVATVEVVIRRVDELTEDVKVLKVQVAELRGDNLERKFRELAPAYFGRRVRRLEVLSRQALAWFLEEAAEQGRISWEDQQEILLADAVLRGRLKESGEEIHLVAEVSAVVDASDVVRAADRAARLARLVGRAVPVVAGEKLTAGVEERCREAGVVCVTDGRVVWP